MVSGNHSGSLPVRAFSYEDGISEIDTFYSSPVPAARTQNSQGARKASKNAALLARARSEGVPTATRDGDAMEGMKQPHHFESLLAESPTSATSNEQKVRPQNPYNKASGSRRAGETDVRSRSPVPPSSSSRGELLAEMRYEETGPTSPMPTPTPVPFSLSKDKVGGDGKHGASSSPLTVKRPPQKKVKGEDNEENVASSSQILPESPIGSDISSIAHEPAETEEQAEPAPLEIVPRVPNTKTKTYRRGALSTGLPTKRITRNQSLLAHKAADDTTTGTTAVNQKPPLEESEAIGAANTASAQEPRSNDDPKAGDPTADQSPNSDTHDNEQLPGPLPQKSAILNHRRPMGSSELKNILGTNMLQGVHPGTSPQRMTRRQKLEREANKPGASAKEAVKRRRRESSGKGGK